MSAAGTPNSGGCQHIGGIVAMSLGDHATVPTQFSVSLRVVDSRRLLLSMEENENSV